MNGTNEESFAQNKVAYKLSLPPVVSLVLEYCAGVSNGFNWLELEMFFGFLLQDYSIATLHALHQRNIESGGQPVRDTFNRIGQHRPVGAFLK